MSGGSRVWSGSARESAAELRFVREGEADSRLSAAASRLRRWMARARVGYSQAGAVSSFSLLLRSESIR